MTCITSSPSLRTNIVFTVSVIIEMEELAKHGITLPPNMQGLTDEQISDLNLQDQWEDECIPSGGVIENKDPIGRRNGKG